MVQFSSVAQLCVTLCDPMNCSTPGLPVHHQLVVFHYYFNLEFPTACEISFTLTFNPSAEFFTLVKIFPIPKNSFFNHIIFSFNSILYSPWGR